VPGRRIRLDSDLVDEIDGLVPRFGTRDEVVRQALVCLRVGQVVGRLEEVARELQALVVALRREPAAPATVSVEDAEDIDAVREVMAGFLAMEGMRLRGEGTGGR